MAATVLGGAARAHRLLARRVGAVLAVIDTLAHWSGLEAEKEKDAGAVQAKMRPASKLSNSEALAQFGAEAA